MTATKWLIRFWLILSPYIVGWLAAIAFNQPLFLFIGMLAMPISLFGLVLVAILSELWHMHSHPEEYDEFGEPR